MEDYVLLIISIALMGTVLMGVKMLKGQTKVKTSKVKATDTLTKVTDETIDRLQLELRKAHGRANRLQALRNGEIEDEEDQPTGKQVTFEEITALVKASYPKYSALLPLVKKQVMEATEGMDMEEILTYVKQFTGNKQPQESIDGSSIAWNKDWA